MRGLGTAGRLCQVGVERWSRIEREPLQGNVFAHSTDADHSETLADTFAAHLDGCGVVLSRA